MSHEQDPEWEIGFYESIYQRDPRYTEVVGILGHLYTKVGRIADGLKMDRRMVRLCPEDPLAHYNLACSLALSDRPRDALKSLRHAVEIGYRDAKWMAEDDDLACLRELPEFQDLLNSLAGK